MLHTDDRFTDHLGAPLTRQLLMPFRRPRQHQDNNVNSELTDDALVEREESERREYLRLATREPRLRDTTYRALGGSRGLIRAWERWWTTRMARRLRGLISSESRRRETD